MPTLKARVFSNQPGNAASLAEALRQCGYQVEILRADATPASTADLEILLETCATADAVRRATELAVELDADVAVAPGSLTVVLSQSLEVPAQPHGGHESDLGSRQKAVLPTADQKPIVMEGGQESDSPQRADSVPDSWRRGISAAAVSLSAWAMETCKILALAQDQARRHKEHALIELAHVRAEREERLLELTHERIQAQERASKLASARKNAAIYLEQLQRESGGRIQASTDDSTAHETRGGWPQLSWPSVSEKLRERLRFVRWDTALAGLASAGALFAIGLAAASFNTKPALSASEDHVSAFTSSTAPVASQPSLTAIQSTPRPTSAHVRSAKPSPGQHVRPGRERAAVAAHDQAAANDVVIRHLAAPKPTPKVQAEGWKHFSDMDR